MIAVINETDDYQMGVVVDNLRHLNGMKLFELYGDEEVTVSNEEIVLRMKPRVRIPDNVDPCFRAMLTPFLI